MNIELDKDDLFRNAIPGYVFFVVIVSFYAATGKISDISNTAQAVLAIAAGFPLGFIFHCIYRFIHIVSFEQQRMEGDEANFIEERLNSDMIKKLQLDVDSKRRNRELSQLFELYLNKDENKSFKSRTHFLLMRVHSLSGSVIAIMIALIAILWLKYRAWGFIYPWKDIGYLCPISRDVNLLVLFWLVIAWLFCRVRKNSKDAYELTMRRMMVNCWKNFENFIGKNIVS